LCGLGVAISVVRMRVGRTVKRYTVSLKKVPVPEPMAVKHRGETNTREQGDPWTQYTRGRVGG